jgi:hypothetical protein
MSDAIQLIADRSVDLRNAVTVDVAPQRRNAVQITATRLVDQLETLGRYDHRCRLATVRLHRSEGMPDVTVVVGTQ